MRFSTQMMYQEKHAWYHQFSGIMDEVRRTDVDG